jgi:hypothetical protein
MPKDRYATIGEMADGITLHILGDYGPFSRMGKSIGYQITIGGSRYLIDCGAPLFQQIGGHMLKGIKGLVVTHCHDDHKRWFTDLALFNMYAPDFLDRVCLYTSEDVHQELMRASGPALDKSLSLDSRSVVDIRYRDYVDYTMIGPLAKLRITSIDHGEGKTALCVTGADGSMVPPDRAKIVISPKTGRPRLLFKDPDYNEWIEPDSFYSFSSEVFYEKEKNIYRDEEGFTMEALKAPVWHGITGIGLRIKTGEETLVFSSDTNHDRELWDELCGQKRAQRLNMSKKEFESAPVIYGDINDFIERVWSRERYRDAVGAFEDSVVIHDISVGKSVVHTSYERLDKTSLTRERAILTHSPDKITSEWVLSKAGKTFKIKGKDFFELVGGRLYPMNADIYHKEEGRYFAGYRNEMGAYTVCDKAGKLSLSGGADEEDGRHGTPLYRVDLYEDVSGGYFPKLESTDARYLERRDGRVELIEFTGDGSRGTIVEDHRERLLQERGVSSG